MRKITTITIMIISILLVSLGTIAATYSVIIEVTEKDGITEIVNEIKVIDLLTNSNGTYNQTYYDIKNEVEATDNEANILINSTEVNEALQEVLKSIVDYKVNNNIDAKLSSDEIYNLITNAILHTDDISDNLKSRIINKASIYRSDISDYLYDIEVSKLEDYL